MALLESKFHSSEIPEFIRKGFSSWNHHSNSTAAGKVRILLLWKAELLDVVVFATTEQLQAIATSIVVHLKWLLEI